MRIAYVCADRGIPVFGQKGCSIHVQEILRSFIKKGLSVDLIASRFDGQPADDLLSVKVHAMDRVGKQEGEDFSGQVDFINLQVADLLRRLGPFDFIYERYSLWSTAAMSYALKQGIPGVLEVNAPLIMEEKKHRNLVHESLALQCERQVFGDASFILGVSDQVCAYVRSRTQTSGTKKIKTIPNGISPQRFSGMKQLKDIYHDPQWVTIGFIGSLKPWHGLESLIMAFGNLKKSYGQLRLLIVGDGPQKDQIVEQVKRMGINDSVELTGAVVPDCVPQCLSRMDIAVAPYPPMEDFYFSPLKVYEYMAAGLPVVVSRIGQLKDLIEPKQNGLFFEPGSVISLTDALRSLIENPQLRIDLGQRAQEQILSRFTWGHVADEILQSVAQIKSDGAAVC